MTWTLSVVQIPGSEPVLLFGIFMNPCHFGGGGSYLQASI